MRVSTDLDDTPPAASAESEPAKLTDALWLVLTIVNVALALWILPDKVLKSDWLDLLSGKIAPWLASSAFVAGYTWWRDEILGFSRSRAFRILQVALFPPLLLAETPLLVIRAELSPPNAQLWIDGERATRTRADWNGSVYEHEVRLLARPHRLELRQPEYWDKEQIKTETQEIELGWGDVMDAILRSRRFHWSVVWPVTITAPCKPDRMIVARDVDTFDWNYLTTWARGDELRAVARNPPYSRLSWDDAREFSAVEVLVPTGDSKSMSKTIRLPAGTYHFLAVRKGIPDESIGRAISANTSSFIIPLKLCS